METTEINKLLDKEYTLTRRQIIKYSSFFILGLICLNVCIYQALKECNYFDIVVVKREVEFVMAPVGVKKEVPWTELIKIIAPKHGLPEELVSTVIEVESRGIPDDTRYEKSTIPWVNRVVKGKNFPQSVLTNLSTSFGLMQVLGINAYLNDVHFSKLYDPETNIEVGSKILRDCFDYWLQKDASIKNRPSEHTLKALECYNGSSTYAVMVVKKLHEDLLKNFYKGLVESLKSTPAELGNKICLADPGPALTQFPKEEKSAGKAINKPKTEKPKK